ncbi:YjgN family protein [Nitrospirillum sp. BR 11828]|uniref:YjgN family protein n=1 Tax=Nitrospirillum sp. BR 11828 TaxID=3104325 RepID=UPI002ACADF24|nr:YjgN family protein [Nitrospirillum sp. BR 11828]MDZ5647405.1 YjgN family protein [Nitrospirillum sp. BR 11828]
MPDSVDVSSAADYPAHRELYTFRFHGTGREYFPIWIVNVLLSIVTLGVYSAWAKVRTQRYFHEATELDGSRFGYHGAPLAILIGRAIALCLLVPYVILNHQQSLYAFIPLGVFLLLMPWMAVRALRFRLRVTSYRGVRFGFSHAPDALKGAYICYLGLPFLSVFTGGLLYPYVLHQQHRWRIDNCHYGDTPLRMVPATRQFYKIALLLLAIFIPLSLLAVLTILVLVNILGPQLAPLASLPFTYGAGVILVALGGALMHKTAYANTTLGSGADAVHVDVAWERAELLGLYLTNVLLLGCTVGLAYPWVRCRTARYMLERITLRAPNGLNHFTDSTGKTPDAVGDQVSSLFDIDVGIGF